MAVVLSPELTTTMLSLLQTCVPALDASLVNVAVDVVTGGQPSAVASTVIDPVTSPIGSTALLLTTRTTLRTSSESMQNRRSVRSLQSSTLILAGASPIQRMAWMPIPGLPSKPPRSKRSSPTSTSGTPARYCTDVYRASMGTSCVPFARTDPDDPSGPVSHPPLDMHDVVCVRTVEGITPSGSSL